MNPQNPIRIRNREAAIVLARELGGMAQVRRGDDAYFYVGQPKVFRDGDKSFDAPIFLYNENHDERGRFATGDGGGSGSTDDMTTFVDRGDKYVQKGSAEDTTKPTQQGGERIPPPPGGKQVASEQQMSSAKKLKIQQAAAAKLTDKAKAASAATLDKENFKSARKMADAHSDAWVAHTTAAAAHDKAGNPEAKSYHNEQAELHLDEARRWEDEVRNPHGNIHGNSPLVAPKKNGGPGGNADPFRGK